MPAFTPPTFDQLAVAPRAVVLALHNEAACVLDLPQLGPRDVSLPEMARRIVSMGEKLAEKPELARRLSDAWRSPSGRFPGLGELDGAVWASADAPRAIVPEGAERNPDRLSLADLLERDGSEAAEIARRAENRRAARG